jgi:hypothetical protein
LEKVLMTGLFIRETGVKFGLVLGNLRVQSSIGLF